MSDNPHFFSPIASSPSSIVPSIHPNRECPASPSPTSAGSATAAPSIPARGSNRIDLHDAGARMRTLIGHVPHTAIPPLELFVVVSVLCQ